MVGNDGGSGDTDPPPPSTTIHPEPMDHAVHDSEKNQFEIVYYRADFSIMHGKDESVAAKRNVRSLVAAIITMTNADVTFMSKDNDLSFQLLKDFPNEEGAFGRFFSMTTLDRTHAETRKAVVEISIWHRQTPSYSATHHPYLSNSTSTSTRSGLPNITVKPWR
jgi:hypothetical protein